MDLDILLNLLRGILEEGFIYGIMVIGVYITYHILDFPDLSVDGTFPLGAAVTASLILIGADPYAALLVSFAAGAAAGLVTGLLHVKLKITDLLSGILVMTGLYTVNLRIANNTSLLSIMGSKTIFNSGIGGFLKDHTKYAIVIIVFIAVLIVKFILDWYLKTKSGMLLRATGDNKEFVTLLAKDSGKVKILGLALGNGIVALSGSILCQKQNYFDNSMGTGMIVLGVASVIIGLTIFSKFSKMKKTTKVIIGSVIYKACLSLALNLGFHPSDMKLIMAVLFTLALLFNRVMMKRGQRYAQGR